MIDFDVPQTVSLDVHRNGGPELTVAEFSDHFPFYVKRHYFLKSGPSKCSGGRHAHKALWQFFTCVTGSCKLRLEGKKGYFEFQLKASSEGVIVPPGYWRDYELQPNTCLSVLASETYNEDDYIRDYDTFKREFLGPIQTNAAPLVAVDRLNASLRSQLMNSFEQELDRNQLILGDSVRAFEAAFASYCDVDFAIGCGNGLDGLTLALRAFGIGEGDEVIVQTNSFIATALAVSQTGAVPVFVDCLPHSGEPDTSNIERVITPRTKAIIPVHLYGVPVDMASISRIASNYDLFVIEDAAQAHGALFDGQKIGSLGHAAAFSFYPTKNLGAIGDAGCVVTNSHKIADKVRLLSNYGSGTKYTHEIRGTNSRMDSIQANFLLTKLPFLKTWNDHRQRLAEIYYSKLSKIAEISLVKVTTRVEPVWHIFPIFLADGASRDGLQNHLRKHSIGTGIHYPIPIHKSGAYQSSASFPIAEDNARTQLSLPIDGYVSEEEVLYVCRTIHSYFETVKDANENL